MTTLTHFEHLTHTPGRTCTEACEPAEYLIGVDDNGRWQIHWPASTPEETTRCGWGISASIARIPVEAMPAVTFADVVCSGCLPHPESVARILGWLA